MPNSISTASDDETLEKEEIQKADKLIKESKDKVLKGGEVYSLLLEIENEFNNNRTALSAKSVIDLFSKKREWAFLNSISFTVFKKYIDLLSYLPIKNEENILAYDSWTRATGRKVKFDKKELKILEETIKSMVRADAFNTSDFEFYLEERINETKNNSGELWSDIENSLAENTETTLKMSLFRIGVMDFDDAFNIEMNCLDDWYYFLIAVGANTQIKVHKKSYSNFFKIPLIDIVNYEKTLIEEEQEFRVNNEKAVNLLHKVKLLRELCDLLILKQEKVSFWKRKYDSVKGCFKTAIELQDHALNLNPDALAIISPIDVERIENVWKYYNGKPDYRKEHADFIERCILNKRTVSEQLLFEKNQNIETEIKERGAQISNQSSAKEAIEIPTVGKSKKWVLKIIVTVILLSVIAVAVYFGMKQFEKQQQTSNNIEQTTTPAPNHIAPKLDEQGYIKSGRENVALLKFNAAIDDFTNAIKLNPSNEMTFKERGNAKSELKDYNGAIQDYNKAIELKPDFAVAYNNRGLVKYALDRFSGAIEDFNKAIELQPDYSDFYFNRATAKYEKEDYQEAIDDYTIALELKPEDTMSIYFNRGKAKKLLDDSEGACSDWYKARELGHPEVNDAIEKYCK